MGCTTRALNPGLFQEMAVGDAAAPWLIPDGKSSFKGVLPPSFLFGTPQTVPFSCQVKRRIVFGVKISVGTPWSCPFRR